MVELKVLANNHPKYPKISKLDEIKGLKEIKINCKWSKSKLYLSFSDSDLQKIADEQVDCIIRCCSGILKGKVLNEPRLGILSFHHGDNRINRGGPTGFWEVLNSEPSSGFIIQKLSEELDGGDVLVRGNISTSPIWLLNSANLKAKSNFFLKKLLDDIAQSGLLPKSEGPVLHDRPLYKLKTIKPLIKYIWLVLVPIIKRKIVGKLLSPEVTRWSVAYAKHENFKKSLWRYKEIKNPKGRFLSDPFVFYHDGKTVIFVEDLFYSDDKGRISAIEIEDENEKFLGVVLEENFHLSFPYIFESKGTVYMIPETHETKDIRLYECVKFPSQWRLKEILMKEVSAANTMLFKNSEKWFMLTNICSAGLGDHQSELHIYWSDSIDSQSWNPIASGNPVIFDSEKARNGGFFCSGNALYRINQIHGTNIYGKAFGINIVDNLNTESYNETRIKNVEAEFKEDCVSTHHFNANNQIAVVDYCRRERLRKILSE